MKKQFQKLNKILSDNKSGSAEILLKLKKHILKNLNDEKYLKLTIAEAENHLQHFASVKNFLKELKSELKKSDLTQLKLFLEYSILAQTKEIELLFERNKKYLMKFKVLTTLSYSKTLLELLKLWYKENPALKIFILESRPMLEGRIFAKELIKIGFHCHLVVDATMNFAVQNSDAVVIGADQILKNGNVVNKVGSFPLALCAKENKKPFIVIATKNKFMNSIRFTDSKKPDNEVWNYKHTKLQITNFYFEEIPANYISKIIF
ncbi:MAG: hypothetical protein ACK4R9_04810 [Ignavibacterium sp.]